MRSSALFLIAALAGSGFCQSYTTFKDFLDTLPSCARSCGVTTFKKIADGCGGEGAKIECICNGPGDVTYSQAEADGRQGGQCTAQNCNSNDALSFTDNLLDLTKFCIANYNTSDSASGSGSSSGASSGSSSGSSPGSSSGSNSSSSSDSNKLVASALALGLVGFSLAVAI